MTCYRDPNRVQTVTERTYTRYGWTITHTDLRRLTGLIMLAFVILNGMIALRFLLKLLAANPASPFAQLIYFFTAPFLWPFQGLLYTPTFGGCPGGISGPDRDHRVHAGGLDHHPLHLAVILPHRLSSFLSLSITLRKDCRSLNLKSKSVVLNIASVMLHYCQLGPACPPQAGPMQLPLRYSV